MPSKKKSAKDVTPPALESTTPAAAKPAAPKRPSTKAVPPKAAAPASASPAAAPKAPAKPAAKPAPAKLAPAKPAASKAAPVATASPKAAAPKSAAPKAAPAVPVSPKQTAPKLADAKPPVAKKGASTSAKAAPAPTVESPKPAPAAKRAASPKAAPGKPAGTSAPAAAKPPLRIKFGALGGLDDPDDDDLDDEDEDAAPAAAPDDDEVATPTALADHAPPPPKRLTPRVVPPMPARKPGVITLALSPDADDAFMLYALEHGKIETETRRYEFVRADIATLNDDANKGTYDVTAFSFGAWPQIVERYLALPCGGSFGDGVGPVVVSKTLVRPNEVEGMLVGVPGLSTTAALVLRLWLSPHRLRLVPVPFAEVVEAVKGGKVRAGVLIHEAQLTYRLDGLAKVMDLGRWWTDKTEGLPLPLGGTAIRRDIPPEERTKIALDLKRSIAYAMGHRDEALEHAGKFSKGLPRPLLDRYITMYVNELTLDIGERGRQAVHTLFDFAVRMGTMRERIDLELA